MKYAVIPVTPYQQNCSIIVCDKSNKAAIIDPGGDLPRLIQAVDELGVEVEKVLLTHGHLDHCAIADDVRKHFSVPIEGPHEADKFWIERLPDWCAMANFPPAEPFESDRWLNEGDEVFVGEQCLQVKHCPGHTPGHVVFFHEGAKHAWVGDVLFQGSIGRTDFPRGNYDELVDSIRNKLWPLGDDVTFISGHGPNSTFGAERKTNAFVADTKFG
ncbi:MBL fold metallo-hydrolase [bacterium]|nr:MBL fold metallo-hydrolase [bacterium]